MYESLVINRLCRSAVGFRCSVCEVELGASRDELLAHVQTDADHLRQLGPAPRSLKLDRAKCAELVNNGIVQITKREYSCTFCACTIPKLDHITEHVSGKRHITKRRKVVPDSDLDRIHLKENKEANKNGEEIDGGDAGESFCGSPENAVDLSEKQECNDVPRAHSNEEECLSRDLPVFCNNCQDNLTSESALLYHRMFHLSQRNRQLTDIVSFSINKNSKCIYCLICDYKLWSEDDFERHLKDDAHQKRLIVLRCPNNDTIVNTMYLNTALYPNIVIPSNMNTIYNTLNAEFSRYLYYLERNIYQSRVQKHQISDKMLFTNDSQLQHQQMPLQDKNAILPSYFCFICNIKFIDENLLYLHYSYDFIHKYRMEAIVVILRDEHMKFISFNNNEVIKCMKCQIQLTELNGAVIHLLEHSQITLNGITLTSNRNLYACPICKINVTSDYMMTYHLISDYHKLRSQEHYSNVNNELFEKIIFFCPACKMNFFNDKTLLEHFQFQHQNVLNNDIPANNVVYPNANNMFLIANNPPFINVPNNPAMQHYYNVINKNAYPMPLNNINYMQNNSAEINLSMNYQQKCTAIINKQQSTCNQDKNSTTKIVPLGTQTLINFSPRYVKLCIERGDENIFTINDERMRKLKLGISLTFPYESNRCCIPCGYEVSSDPQLLYEHLRTEDHEKNFQDMEDNHRYFEYYQDQLSDLELAKAYMYEDSDEWVKCYACDIKIENCEINLKNHIDSDVHIYNHQFCKKSADEITTLFSHIFENLWYYIEKFSCNLCSETFESEVYYARHLEDIKHLKEVEQRIIKKQSLQFDCCILCSSYWYAKSDQHKIHCSKNSHKYTLKSRDFTVPEMSDQVKDFLYSTEETMENLLIESNQVFSTGIEKQLLENIEAIVKPKFPHVRAHLFGSRISNLSFQNSDLDIYLNCNNGDKILESKEFNEDQLITVGKCFYNHQEIWKIKESIFCAKIPIIKLIHRSTNLNCDISIFNSIAVEKSKILGYFVNACLPCRKLILYLKKWSILCKLSGRKGINSFAMSWFVIFYLQIKGILPSVQQLIEQKNDSHVVTGWETGVAENISVQETNLSIKDLLQGFFLYYAEFNYISDVACPFLGKLIKKSKFSNIDSLPDEMSFYKTQIKEDKIEFFRLDSPMCIQEPIDLSQNITKSVTKLQLRIFKQYCAESAEILTV